MARHKKLGDHRGRREKKGRYMTADRKKAKGRWSVRRKLTVAVSALLTLAAAVAVAAYFSTAVIKGGVNTSDFQATFSNGPGGVGPVIDATGGLAGNVALNGTTGEVTINVTSGYPGSHLVINTHVRLKTGATEDGKISGLALNGLPANWKAEIANAGDGCGAIVSKTGSVVPVSVKITMSENANPASSGTFGSGSGVQVSPVSQAGAITCPLTFNGGAS